MTAALPSTTALEMILEWSINRPAWQRDALRRIMLVGKINDKDVDELTIICKESRSQSTKSNSFIPLDRTHLPSNPNKPDYISLLSIKDVYGVNILAPDQTLPLEPTGMTIIYGDNGAGKSGYSRILKRACGARHRGEIIPNIYASEPVGPASATITYNIGKEAQPPATWQDSDRPHPQLSAISIFDRECGSIHIENENEISFLPFGLDIPEELVRICKLIDNTLNVEVSDYERKKNLLLFIDPPWKEHTIVGKAIKALAFDTDVSKLSEVALLTHEEKVKLERLREDLPKDILKASREQISKAANIGEIINTLEKIEKITSEHNLNQIYSIYRDAKAKREAASIAAKNAFSNEKLQGVGAEAWRELWEAARRYSTQAAYLDQPFPLTQDESLCVLCQTPLNDEGKERMVRFEQYIQNDTERRAQEAEELADSKIRLFIDQEISTRMLKRHLRELATQDNDLSNEIRYFLYSSRLRRCLLMKALSSNQEVLALPPQSTPPTRRLKQLEQSLQEYGNKLQQSGEGDTRKKLQHEFEELSARHGLYALFPKVQEEIERLKKIHLLKECLADTKTAEVTKLGNDIADAVITRTLQAQFKEEIKKLAANRVKVELARSGGKLGLPHYQVRFSEKPKEKVGKILCDGEKTCIALAAFLTELAIAPHNSTLVFDDPISSLDNRYRPQVAKRLVEEAEKRQIVVFTHDLIFFNDLHHLATNNNKKIASKCISIFRGPKGTGMVDEENPWVVQKIKDRIDKLEKKARLAKILYDEFEENKYRDKAVEFYNKLRACWESALESIVFAGIILRHRDYIDTKHIKNLISLTDEERNIFTNGFKKCCDFTDAHDPSIGRNAAIPPPHELLQDIETFKNWVAALKARQN